jgi:hypothetical protein
MLMARRYSLKATPLSVMLEGHKSLFREAAITGVNIG